MIEEESRTRQFLGNRKEISTAMFFFFFFFSDNGRENCFACEFINP
jgi:hypothetical protein